MLTHTVKLSPVRVLQGSGVKEMYWSTKGCITKLISENSFMLLKHRTNIHKHTEGFFKFYLDACKQQQYDFDVDRVDMSSY